MLPAKFRLPTVNQEGYLWNAVRSFYFCLVKCLYLICLLGLLSPQLLRSQEAIPNELIVQWKTEAGMSQNFPGLEKRQALSQTQATELLIFADRSSCEQARRALDNHHLLLALQSNHQIEFRRTPNDSLIDFQDNLDRLNIPRLWDESTGGTTVNGEDIVVAVLDSGFDIEHEDLRDNLWHNAGEIDGDGIDNDENGFIDDINGWSFPRDRPRPEVDVHGTSVIGILGAQGNNEIGVSGINWDIRMMLLQINDVADIIAAYDYVIEQRRRWQESNGAEGAFVVATNASFGLEQTPCSNFPIWAQQYDRLGELGILTAASTANVAWDVEDFGDMPTSCTTDFIIGVANSDTTDALFRSSAWGTTSVDLSAPGEGSVTTTPNNNYGGFGSTSAAAPYVTGTIALLYSQDCPRLQTLARQDPPAAARLVREAILSSTRPIEFLDRLLVTGGMLESWAAWRKLEILCNPEGGPLLEIEAFVPNPARNTTEVWFDTPRRGPYEIRLFDALGREVALYQIEALPPARARLDFPGLTAGIYAVSLWDGEELAWKQLIVQ